MIELLTPNTQAILLLTAPLIAGRGEPSSELLTWGEYNRLTRILREKQKEPADLIGPDAEELIELCAQPFSRTRLGALLGRGFLLSQAVERWNARAIWVISRADSCYPKRLKARLKGDAPPLLYGCGDIALLEKGGLAVVGSRHVDDELIDFTETVGRISAQAHRTIVSGGAKGIDRAAMHGALLAGGDVTGVLADSLERAALARDNREPLMEVRLVLVSPYDPAAGFNVGHAMQRNKLIYALADAALVVTADFEKGGTWTGAIEQLDRFRFVPVFVRNGVNAGKGNAALLHRGGKLWPNPQNGNELEMALVAAAQGVASEPKQDALPLTLPEEPSADAEAPVVKGSQAVLETIEQKTLDAKLSPDQAAVETFDQNTPDATLSPDQAVVETIERKTPDATLTPDQVGEDIIEQNTPDAQPSPEAELLNTVREILRRELVEARTQEEVATLLVVTKTQAKTWLVRLVAESVLEKVTKPKPARYRTTHRIERLL